MDSDESFARRLQAQEMGFPINDNTPLMTHNNISLTPNTAILNNRGNDNTSNERVTVIAILSVNLPQIISAIIVLSLHYNDPYNICDLSHENKWRIWSIIATIRMSLYSLIVIYMFIFKNYLNDRPRYVMQLNSFRNMIDALGVIWFVVGNMWLFGDDDNSCKHPEKSPIYKLCVSMLVINYIQICLPCILAAIMIPLFCFCMPCLIRVMARLNNRAQGASAAAIDSIPLITLGQDAGSQLQTDDLSCPICLNDMVTGEQVRLLTCKHSFHRQCVDEWLRVNATCPSCRKSILHDGSTDISNSPLHSSIEFSIRDPSSSQS